MVYSIQFSICSGVILLATFVPKGAFSLNPKTIEGVRNEQEFDEDSLVDDMLKMSEIEGDKRKQGDPTFVAP